MVRGKKNEHTKQIACNMIFGLLAFYSFGCLTFHVQFSVRLMMLLLFIGYTFKFCSIIIIVMALVG